MSKLHSEGEGDALFTEARTGEGDALFAEARMGEGDALLTEAFSAKAMLCSP